MWIRRRIQTQTYRASATARDIAGEPLHTKPAHGAHRWVHGWRRTASPASASHRAALANALLFIALIAVLGGVGMVRVFGFRSTPGENIWRGALAHAFEKHYDEVFPVKRFGVNLWAATEYVLFREGLPGVIVGHGGWLYTDEEFKLDNDSAAQVQRNLALITWVQRELEHQHVALMVALVPAKARVYPEHLDGRQPPALRQAGYANALAYLHAHGTTAVDLLPSLRDNKQRHATFLRTDTHWTPYGAYMAAQTIAGQATHLALANGSFETREGTPREHRGDLFNFLPLDPWFAGLLPAPDVITPAQTTGGSQGGGLLGDAPHPQVALVGTSYSAESSWNFAGALEQAMGTDVLNYAKDGEGPFAPMLAYMRSTDFRAAPPALVIWEVPERYLTLPSTALAAYHLPPDAFESRMATFAAARGDSSREGGSSSHDNRQH